MVPLHADASLAPRKFETTCSNCNLRELCLPRGPVNEQTCSASSRSSLRAASAEARRPAVSTPATTSTPLYAVRTGFFKTSVIARRRAASRSPASQMAGELLGMDGIGTEPPQLRRTIALEDSEVCVMPFSPARGAVAAQVRALQRHLHRIMSREIVRDHGVMLLLGSMRAEERLAAFLLNLSKRLHASAASRAGLPICA